MKLVIPKGATSRIITVFIQNNSVTTGAGLGSLNESSSIVGGYVREGGTGVALAVDENVTTEGTYQAPSAAGKVRIGTPANMRTGTYEFHFHNDLFATGAETLTITLGGATNMADIAIEIQLSDPVRGLGAPTALPNAAADAAGGLPISDAGGLDLDAKIGAMAYGTANRLNVQVYGLENNTITAAVIADAAIDAATFAADVDAEILSYIVDDATRIDASALNTASVTTIPAILDDTDLIDDATSGLAKIATDVAAILVDTGTDGVVVAAGSKTGYTLTATTGLGNQTADITGTVSTVTNLTNAPTNGDLTATMKASVNTEVDSAIETYHLDHLLAATYDPASKPGAADALLNELIGNDAGVSQFTANALELAPTGGSAPTVGQIADEVQTRTIAGVTLVATTTNLTNLPAAAATAAELAKVPKSDSTVTWNATALASINAEADTAISDAALATAANLATVAGYLDTEIAAILADTNELQTDWANGGRLDLILDGIVSDLPARITKNTALSAFSFIMVSSTDHVTPTTGLTVTATRSLDGAAFEACANAVSEIGSGWYKIDLAAADLNANIVALKFTATGADATNLTIPTQPT